MDLIRSGAPPEELREVLSKFTAKDAIVLREKYGDELKKSNALRVIGQDYDVTRNRILEFEKKAKKKLNDRPGDKDLIESSKANFQ